MEAGVDRRSGRVRPCRSGRPFGLSIYVVLLSALVTILSIVSPPLVQEPGIVLFVAAIAAGVVILPRILFSAFSQRLNVFPGYSVDPLYADAALKPMILNLRVRSRLYKVGAVTAFLFIAVATLVGFTVVHTAVEQNPLSASEPSDTLVGSAVVAVVLLLFLLRTLASIYRYNMRLAAFYDSRADYLQAGGSTGSTRTLSSEQLLRVFSPPDLDPGWAEKLKGVFKPNTPG